MTSLLELPTVREREDWVSRHPVTAPLVVEVAMSSAAVDGEKAHIFPASA